MIKAPYNFVPLSDRVVFPEWAGRISHDMPFSDGLSGSITVRLTARTPIFVRNGHSRDDDENSRAPYQSFSVLPDGRYFLPGTTVKGAVRSVLEIMSFSKMRLDKEARFAQREWDNPHLYTLKNEQLKLRCGWLHQKGEDYEITDCGRPYRIAQTEIDDYLGVPLFRDKFSDRDGIDLNKEYKLDEEKYDPKSSVFKYRLVEQVMPIGKLRNLSFFNYEGSNKVCVSPTGDITGTIVFTGQPDRWVWPRKPKGGKFYEFVFRQPNSGSKKYSLTKDEFNQYKFIYADSPDWEYAKEKLMPSTGIPVFFRVENGKIKDWGLAFLYKLPYAKTPYDTLPEDHKSEKHDMAECIFGYTRNESSLRGRVQFTPFLSNNAQEDRSCTLALCGPKASYYPIYIDQHGSGTGGRIIGKYKTYNDSRIKGWKRYVVRRSVWNNCTGLEKIDTVIHPLKAGTAFEGKIMFHNLKPEELGALLSALTFHGNEADCFHQLGMARPYGYGKVKVDIREVDIRSVGLTAMHPETNKPASTDARFYMAVFENYMKQKIGGLWTGENSVREVITLARNEVVDNTKFDYMKLEMKGRNEFVEAKGGKQQKGTKEYLQYYSDIIGNKAMVKSLISTYSSAIDDMQARKEAAKAERERQRQDREKEKANRERQEKEDEERRKAAIEAQAIEDAKKEKVEAGLSVLNKKFETGVYVVTKFSTLKSKVVDWLKIAELDKVPEKEYGCLTEALIRLSKSPSRDEKRKKLWTNRGSSLWVDIEKLTSPEFADKVFKEINPDS